VFDRWLRSGIIGSGLRGPDVKKIYVKPILLKKGRLSAVTALNGASVF
jgi:hypothetical protein